MYADYHPIGIKSRAARRFFQPHAGRITIREFDPGLFEGALDRFDRARLERFSGFEQYNRSSCDLHPSRQFADAQLEGCPSHPALGGIH